ncbi:fumarylacetoacetate hydrolase family protein [Chitinimonas sp. PSY-7]|uniref:fumarylacetoacetate hydrolase family protein n=1 Tax=Chitinimonas sp. PSY-7 TaxID=3459088 RepID=UPI00403FFC16
MPAIRFTDHRELPVANIFCIGRNYAAHAAELGNKVEPEPVVFLKPTSALLHEEQKVVLPAHSRDVHYEGELVLVVGTAGKNIHREAALSHIAGYGLGLDLTARDLQSSAKEKGLPWAVAKGFDGAACVSRFLSAEMIPQPLAASFWLDLNGVRRQDGDCMLMIYDLPCIIEYLSSRFALQVGDLIYTGTPAGVGALQSGDVVKMGLLDKLQAQFTVA